jgi:hypothetical protein
MITVSRLAILLATLGASVPVLASSADTRASASGGRRRSGTASAEAHYTGDVGFARSETRTGSVNASRAVAVGVDRDGLSLSVSTALAPRNGRAIATTFNVSIGSRGVVARGSGQSVASGGRSRSVSAGGAVSTGTRARPAAAQVVTSGRTEHGGVVRARSDTSQSRRVVRIVRRLVRR